MEGLNSEIKDIKGNRTEVDIRFNARFNDDVRIKVCDLYHEICDKLHELIKLNEKYKNNKNGYRRTTKT